MAAGDGELACSSMQCFTIPFGSLIGVERNRCAVGFAAIPPMFRLLFSLPSPCAALSLLVRVDPLRIIPHTNRRMIMTTFRRRMLEDLQLRGLVLQW